MSKAYPASNRFLIAAFFLLNNFVSPVAQAQTLVLPFPGAMVSLSPAFTPLLLKGVTVYSENPYKFDFLLTSGNEKLQGSELREQSEKLIKYFLTAITVPDKDMWVNLSPYEKHRVIPDDLAKTDMGRDLLAQDYILKVLASSLTYPEKELGKNFWSQVYQKIYEQLGTTDIPVSGFNKVWVMADSATVYVQGLNAYVVKSHLKVVSEQDVLSAKKSQVKSDILSAQVMRETVIPLIEHEVNEGKNFSQLRQIYNSLILATWFKKNLKQNIMARRYANKNKVSGIDIPSPNMKQAIYEHYLKAFKKGVYNYIKEENSPGTNRVIPRKYFSGGMTPALAYRGENSIRLDEAMTIDRNPATGMQLARELTKTKPIWVSGQVRAVSVKGDSALITTQERLPWPLPNVINGRGTKTPEFGESEILMRLILHLTNNGRQAIPQDTLLNKDYGEELDKYFVKDYGKNMLIHDKKNLLEGLRQRGLIRIFKNKQGKVLVNLKEKNPRVTAVWARDTQYVLDDLREQLNNGKEFLKAVDDYNEVVNIWPRYPKEAMDPVLRAIGLMTKEEKMGMLALIAKRSPESTPPLMYHIFFEINEMILEEGSVAEQHYKVVKKSFLRQHMKNLIGRNVYMLTPEYVIFKGGLGRVMKFHGDELKELGAEVVYIQPQFHFVRTGVTNSLVKYAEANLPIKLTDEVRVPKEFSTFITRKGDDGKYYTYPIKFNVNKGLTEENKLPVYSIEVDDPRIFSVLYEHKGSRNSLTDLTEHEIDILIQKATLEVMRYIELEKKKDMEAKGEHYKAPIIVANDGQEVAINVWMDLFYGNKDHITRDATTSEEDIQATYEIFRDALRVPFTHTYGNRHSLGGMDFDKGIALLTAAGVPPEKLWLFVRVDIDGTKYIDLTSGGLRAGDVQSGVAAKHAYDMNARDPGLNMIAVTNGDLIKYTNRYFRQYLNKVLGVKKNIYDITPQEGAMALAKAKYELSKEDALFYEYKRLGLNIDPKKKIISYSGRGVPEKLEITHNIIRAAVAMGYQFILYVNRQADDRSDQMIQDFLDLQQKLSDEGYRENGQYDHLGRFIIRVGFNIDDQQKLQAASDIQAQFSTGYTEAAGATEAHSGAAFGLQASFAPWEGLLNRIGDMIHWSDKTGNVLVPNNNYEHSIIDLLAKASEAYHEWGWDDFLANIPELNDEFIDYHRDVILKQIYANPNRTGLPQLQHYGIMTSPAYSAVHTAAVLMRVLNDKVKELEEYLDGHDQRRPSLERIAGEVSFDQMFLYVNELEQVKKVEERPFYIQHDDKDLYLTVRINRRTHSLVDGGEGVVPEEFLRADVVTDFGIRYPFKRINSSGDYTTLEVHLPADLPYDSNGHFTATIEYTSGIQKKTARIGVARNKGVLGHESDLRFENELQPQADLAQTSTVKKQTIAPGGILLDPTNLNLTVNQHQPGVPTGSLYDWKFRDEDFLGFSWQTNQMVTNYIPHI